VDAVNSASVSPKRLNPSPQGFDVERLINGSAQETVFFPGCALWQQAADLSNDVYAWLVDSGFCFELFKGCCGLPAAFRGEWARYQRQADALLSFLTARGARRLITACPNCFYALREHVRDRNQPIEIVALSDVLVVANARIPAQDGKVFRVHDSCPDNIERVFAKGVRQLARELTIVEAQRKGDESLCCGAGREFSQFSFDKQMAVARARLGAYRTTDVNAVLVVCGTCAFALSSAADSESDLEVFHYLELLFGRRVCWSGSA
jgi:Fe-S oxidoreductase